MPVEVLVVLWKLQPRFKLLERQRVWPVAVDLVRRGEHERGVGCVSKRRFEQIGGPGGVDREVG